MNDRLCEELRRFGIEPDEAMVERQSVFLDLLLEKNKLLNLTAVTDKEEAFIRHTLDSLIPGTRQDLNGKKIIDVGCGAGFPGMPLLLQDPVRDITLMDSRQKKLDFIADAAAKLGVSPKLLCMRAEDAGRDPAYRDSFDIALSRALARLPLLLEYCLPLIRPGGVFLAIKGKDANEEIAEAEKALKELRGKVEEVFQYSLGETKDDDCCVITVRKTAKTPDDYPRRFKKMKEEPLTD